MIRINSDISVTQTKVVKVVIVFATEKHIVGYFNLWQ